MEWIRLSDKLPTIENQGVKVLLYRIMNEDQKLLSTTIHETAMVKHCNPDETWWMPLPEPPCVGNNVDASVDLSINYDGVLATGVCDNDLHNTQVEADGRCHHCESDKMI